MKNLAEKKSAAKAKQYGQISRRAFLKGSAAAGSALLLAGCMPATENGGAVTAVNTAAGNETAVRDLFNIMPASGRIKFNAHNCSACTACEMACSSVHFGEYNKYLSGIRIAADFEARAFSANICRQCLAASCVAACSVGAIKFDAQSGARYIEAALCIACDKCIEACPFADGGAPVWAVETADGPSVFKCDLCRGREAGPACVEICPMAALTLEA